MAQLADDCFAFGGELMKAEDALALIETRLHPVTAVETIPLEKALGRITAEEVAAARDVPPHDNAAVDGFAVYFDDLGPTETVLPVAGRATAGHPLDFPPRRGLAIRIFTGAQMPTTADGSGPDTVVMEEDCAISPGEVRIPPGLKRGANRRLAGEDIQSGAVILPRGRRLRPADLGLAASAGIAKLPVHTALRVAVLSTGDEICPLSESPRAGQVYDANRHTLIGLLECLGCRVSDLGIIRDDRAAIGRCLESAGDGHDLIISSGGVSAGEEDHVRHAVESLGSLHFWRLAIKPGRPLALGQVGHVPFIGVPGNPVAAAVTFMIFARPAIRALAGSERHIPIRFAVRAGFGYHKKRGRREWIRARLETDRNGLPRAVKFERDGAGILSSITESDGLIELDEDTGEIAPEQDIQFIPFNEFLW